MDFRPSAPVIGSTAAATFEKGASERTGALPKFDSVWGLAPWPVSTCRRWEPCSGLVSSAPPAGHPRVVILIHAADYNPGHLARLTFLLTSGPSAELAGLSFLAWPS